MTAVLLLFVFASLAVMIRRETNGAAAAPAEPTPPAATEAAPSAPETAPSATESAPSAPESAPATNDVLTVFYFHGTQRCMTCNRIEQLARETFETNYADALKDGRIVFRSVNLDEPENGHFVRDFQLVARHVVMEKGGAFETFDKVWLLVRDPEAFSAYLREGADKMLASAR